jgi:hypothetical protein
MNEIAIYKKMEDPLAAIDRVGEFFTRSGMFGCTRTEQGKVLAMVCMTKNMTPDEVAARYHLIDGKISKKSSTVLADFRRLGGRHKWIDGGFDGKKATAEFTFEGNTIEVSFSIEDAKRQGLVKKDSGWEKTPANMLRARVITTAVGMLAPEVWAGSEEDEGVTTVTAEPGLDLGQSEPSKPTAQATGKVVDAEVVEPEKPKEIKTEEEELADQGLAPATPKPKKAKKAKPTIEPGDDGDEPIPPPQKTIEPEAAAEPAPSVEPGPGPEAETLSPDLVDQMGHIMQGNFVKVANWMIENQWIEPASKELKTEAQAGAHLQKTLPTLSPAKAKKVLTQKMAFMRAIESIEP